MVEVLDFFVTIDRKLSLCSLELPQVPNPESDAPLQNKLYVLLVFDHHIGRNQAVYDKLSLFVDQDFTSRTVVSTLRNKGNPNI